MSFPFLTAAWRKLIMAQYEVAPAVLQGKVPHGLELDLYHGRCFVSLVGFLFDRVRLAGVPIPFHTQFEEVNLRFYVRRTLPNGSSRRGVVFLSEVVPRPAVSFVARTLYGESYTSAPTRHYWGRPGGPRGAVPPRGNRRRTRAHFRALGHLPPSSSQDAVAWQPSQCEVDYEWQVGGLWQSLGVRSDCALQSIAPGSLDEFITDHYWGYAPRRGGGTTEYAVEHPRWKLYPVRAYRIACDFRSLYGGPFASLTGRAPDHLLLAEGAPVTIRWGNRIA